MRLRVLAAHAGVPGGQAASRPVRRVRAEEGRAKRAAVSSRGCAAATRTPVAFVHQSPWHVPIRWFVLFDDDERRLRRGRARPAPPALPRLPTRRAMRRAEDAVPVLRRSDLGPIGELILDLHQWLAAFDPRSMLELDYGELVRLPDVGRARRRPQRPRPPRGARGARALGVPAVGRHVPGRPEPLGRDPQPRDPELASRDVVARGRIELPTPRFSAACSAN